MAVVRFCAYARCLGQFAPFPVPTHGNPASLVVTLPPLGVVVFEAEKTA